MAKLVCFRHPDYDGTTPPILSCKVCCGLFIDQVKSRNADDSDFQDMDSFQKNSDDAKRNRLKKNLDRYNGFKPELI